MFHRNEQMKCRFCFSVKFAMYLNAHVLLAPTVDLQYYLFKSQGTPTGTFAVSTVLYLLRFYFIQMKYYLLQVK